MHDSFAMPKFSRLVWVACKDFDTAVAIKKDVCIGSLNAMAKSCEYMDRDCFDVVDRAGRILIKVIDVLGMMNITPLWNLKLFIEALPIPFSKVICDKVLFWFNGIMPESLSAELMDLGRRYDHHMLMEFAEYGDGEVADLESRLKAYIATQPEGSIQYHICEPSAEAGRANLFRFVVAPAFRTYHIGVGKEGLSIDYALPKNFESRPELPAQYPMEKRVQYSHFGCNVYHEDIVFGDGVDVLEAKMAIKKTIEKLGGRLPAEHGHGTEYQAPAEAQQRWMRMDPTNALNPGVGGLGYNKGYATQPVHLAQ
jgi:D-lactate dehydrogenase